MVAVTLWPIVGAAVEKVTSTVSMSGVLSSACVAGARVRVGADVETTSVIVTGALTLGGAMTRMKAPAGSRSTMIGFSESAAPAIVSAAVWVKVMPAGAVIVMVSPSAGVVSEKVASMAAIGVTWTGMV